MRGVLQLALDFFAPPVKGVPLPDSPQQPAAPVATPEGPAAVTPAPAPPVGLRAHPQANREALLERQVVGYALRRSKRRTIGFMIGAEGLVVTAPLRLPLHVIDAAVQEKSGWIVRKLGEAVALQFQREAVRIEWRDGATVHLLGQPLRLVLDGARSPVPRGTRVARLEASTAQLHLALAADAAPDRVQAAACLWLKAQAQQLFQQRLDFYAQQLDVRWRQLRLSSATTRWGSASADGGIRLNWRLIHLDLTLIDYVVVHELSHLRVMDHSPRFWATVASVMPDYAQRRAVLQRQTLQANAST